MKGDPLRQFRYLLDQLTEGLGRIVRVIQGTVGVFENVVAVKISVSAKPSVSFLLQLKLPEHFDLFICQRIFSGTGNCFSCVGAGDGYSLCYGVVDMHHMGFEMSNNGSGKAISESERLVREWIRHEAGSNPFSE